MSEKITLGGGCFWCLEPLFAELQGVEDAVVGYAGGKIPKPSYEAVCTGFTGHAEVVQVTFNPAEITLADLLRVFFTMHDPTTRNRQGNDVGPQYRSVIFYANEAQKQVAEQVIAEITAAGIWERPIVTELSPLKAFYEAEEYHQEYFSRNPGQGYCRVIITPKVAKFRLRYASQLKK